MKDQFYPAAEKSDKIEHASIILLKNIPKDGDKLVEKLMQVHPTPSNIKSFGRRRALISFSSATDARTAIKLIQEHVKGSKIKVSQFFSDVRNREHRGKGENAEEPHNTLQHVEADVNAEHLVMASCKLEGKKQIPKFTQTSVMSSATIMPDVSYYIRSLYACNSRLNFEQPPPPSLWYSYPKMTPTALNLINIALIRNTSFRTQVLHLMNRSNLEPPFEPKTLQGLCEIDTEAQEIDTGKEVQQRSSLAGKAARIIQKPEDHELEETAYKSHNIQCTRMADQFKEKVNVLLQGALSRKTHSSSVRSCKPSTDVEVSTSSLQPQKITFNLRHAPKKDTRESRNGHEEVISSPGANQKLVLEALKDECQQRLSMEELQLLPAFKNYSEGEPSSKLYIKNLSKDVSVADLRKLYSNFVNSEHLNIKVMQHGRMRGQAFIEFKNLREVEYESVVRLALRETNGLILNQKPIFVCFGRK